MLPDWVPVRRSAPIMLALVFGGLGFGLAQATYPSRATAGPADTGEGAATSNDGHDVLRVRRIELTDAAGKVRAVLTVEAEGPRLSLSDAAGKERAVLGLEGLALSDGGATSA